MKIVNSEVSGPRQIYPSSRDDGDNARIVRVYRCGDRIGFVWFMTSRCYFILVPSGCDMLDIEDLGPTLFVPTPDGFSRCGYTAKTIYLAARDGSPWFLILG
jgi:hypothetical protein